MNHYLAITIGPVYKTILQARSTREIWASSYIFSIIMREITHAADAQELGTLLSPKKLDKKAHRFGAGIYPDRAFWQLNQTGDKEKLRGIVTSAVSALNVSIKIDKALIEKYLRLYAITLKEDNNKDSTILRLNQLLDNLELQEKITAIKPDLLGDLVDNIQLLYNDGHPDSGGNIFIEYDWNGKQKRLPSIIEIATRDLKYKSSTPVSLYDRLVTDPLTEQLKQLIKKGDRNKHNETESKQQEEVLKTLRKEYPDDFRFRHKYIAFIKADGDNMGKALETIGNDNERVQEFSTALSEFAGKAAELIVNYGGIPIYAGGDDLLFALPLANSNLDSIPATGQHLFELISKLDDIFPKQKIRELTDNAVTASLSYGISMSYYKYPMDETLLTADQALYNAKDLVGKNAVAFRVRKHSGSNYGACLPKGSSFKTWCSMVKDFSSFTDDAFLSSFMYKLVSLEPLLTDAILHDSVEHLFKNQFNEKDHGTLYDKYLVTVRSLLFEMYRENKVCFHKHRTHTYKLEKTFKAGGLLKDEYKDWFKNNELSDPGSAAALYSIRQLYACLRFIQFINQKDNEQNN